MLLGSLPHPGQAPQGAAGVPAAPAGRVPADRRSGRRHLRPDLADRRQGRRRRVVRGGGRAGEPDAEGRRGHRRRGRSRAAETQRRLVVGHLQRHRPHRRGPRPDRRLANGDRRLVFTEFDVERAPDHEVTWPRTRSPRHRALRRDRQAQGEFGDQFYELEESTDLSGTSTWSFGARRLTGGVGA